MAVVVFTLINEVLIGFPSVGQVIQSAGKLPQSKQPDSARSGFEKTETMVWKAPSFRGFVTFPFIILKNGKATNCTYPNGSVSSLNY